MKFLIISAMLLMSAFGKPQYNPEDAGNSYLFQYGVKHEPTGPNFGHKEMRIGNRVSGMYYVFLPDGLIQKVVYEADENGYRPTVTYIRPQ